MFRYLCTAKQRILEVLLSIHSGEPVLVFHQIDDISNFSNDYGTTKEAFKLLINNMHSSGHSFAPIDDIGQGGKCYLTFDDGYADIMTNVYPFLKDKNIPFCIFITTGFVDSTGHLTWDDLSVLKNEPLCTIGAHTKTHPLLRFCDGGTAEDEIIGSKHLLEDKLGRSIKHFAYPYGSVYACSKRDIEIAGVYKCAFSTISAGVSKKSNPRFLPRITVRDVNMRSVKNRFSI